MNKKDILDHPDLRKVWDGLESAAPTMAWDNLDVPHMPDRRAARPTGVWVAVAVFAGTLVIGGLTWRLATDGSQPIAAGPAADTFFAFASEGALVLSDDPLILQPAPGPQPQFDTSAVGTEVKLIPASTIEDIPDGFLSASDGTSGQEAGVALVEHCVRTPSRPILHIGYVSEIDAALIVYGTISDGRGDYIFERGPEPDQSIACDGFTGYPAGALVRREASGVRGHVTVEVPPLTSLVTISGDGGERMWQRPVAGWALLPYESGMFTVDAYDPAGTLIGHWEESG